MRLNYFLLLTFLLGLTNLGWSQSDLVLDVAGTPGVSGSFSGVMQALDANLNDVHSIASDKQGNFYFSATTENKIFKYDITTEELSVYAGTGNAGGLEVGELALEANLNAPTGICFDNDDNLYFAQKGEDACAIRKIDAITKEVTTIVGNGTCDHLGPTVNAVEYPEGIDIDTTGYLYWAEPVSSTIRRMRTTAGTAPIIEDIAGVAKQRGVINGVSTSATKTSVAGGIAVDPEGTSVYYSTEIVHTVNQISIRPSGNTIIRIAGNGNTNPGIGPESGKALEIPLNDLFGMALTENDELFICEPGAGLIRVISLLNGDISTAAGVGGQSKYNGNFREAKMSHIKPKDIAFAFKAGNPDPYFTDSLNHLIRKTYGCRVSAVDDIEVIGTDSCAGGTLGLRALHQLENDGIDTLFWATSALDGSDFTKLTDEFVEDIKVSIKDEPIRHILGVAGYCTKTIDTVSVLIRDKCTIDAVISFNEVTAFSPNGDGWNDYFHLNAADSIPQNKVYIFNRYGELINQFDNYDNMNELKRWNGDWNGEVIPGTYYYTIYKGTDEYLANGWVELLK